MKLRTVLQSLAAGAAIYVTIAACVAADRLPGDPGDMTPRERADAYADALADVIADPTGEANASPLPPEVAEEACAKKYAIGGTTYRYAEHEYPGASAAELAHGEGLQAHARAAEMRLAGEGSR